MAYRTSNQQLLLFDRQEISDAVAVMARAGVEARGPVFTRREVVDFILDLAGYTSDKPRYDIVCQKLVKENLYTAACTLASPRKAATTGEFSDMSELSSLKCFVTAFAGHIAAEAAR